MVHSNNNNNIIIMIVLIPEVPILDQMHLQLNPACNLRFKNEKKKQLGLLHLKITVFFLLASVFKEFLCLFYSS